MKPLSYEVGKAAGVLEERERLRQVALIYIKGGLNGNKLKNNYHTTSLMLRLFGKGWNE